MTYAELVKRIQEMEEQNPGFSTSHDVSIFVPTHDEIFGLDEIGILYENDENEGGMSLDQNHPYLRLKMY